MINGNKAHGWNVNEIWGSNEIEPAPRHMEWICMKQKRMLQVF